MSLLDLGRETYVNLATFRRSGAEVRTPVWIAPDRTGGEERLVVYTHAKSGKVKRIRNDGRVRLAPCNARGHVRGDSGDPQGSSHDGSHGSAHDSSHDGSHDSWQEARARVLEDPAERDRALEALFRKYPVQMRIAWALARLSGRWAERAALEIRAARAGTP